MSKLIMDYLKDNLMGPFITYLNIEEGKILKGRIRDIYVILRVALGRYAAKIGGVLHLYNGYYMGKNIENRIVSKLNNLKEEELLDFLDNVKRWDFFDSLKLITLNHLRDSKELITRFLILVWGEIGDESLISQLMLILQHNEDIRYVVARCIGRLHQRGYKINVFKENIISHLELTKEEISLFPW